MKRAVEAAEERLEKAGCAAADYRLSGDRLEKLCVIHLGRDYRMILGFPEKDEVAVLLIGRHVKSPTLNVYERLYKLLGAKSSDQPRDKPPCCGDKIPPVDRELVDFLAGRIQSFEGDE